MATRTREQRAREKVESAAVLMAVSYAWAYEANKARDPERKKWQDGYRDTNTRFDRALAAYRRAVLAEAKGKP